jgi:hypothetical protein
VVAAGKQNISRRTYAWTYLLLSSKLEMLKARNKRPIKYDEAIAAGS